MPDKMLWERQLPRNTGFAFDLKAGQSMRITSQTIIDFVCFNRENLRERFDQARTKANQRKVFISTGDQLISKLNNAMMTIVEDTFKEGHHDLQEGMCSRKRHELAAAKGIWEKTYGRPLSEMPPRGCTENLGGVLSVVRHRGRRRTQPVQHLPAHDHPRRHGRIGTLPRPAEAAGRLRDATRRDGPAGGDQHLPRHGGRRYHGRDAGGVRGRLNRPRDDR